MPAGALQWDSYIAMTTIIDEKGFISVQYDAFGEEQSGVQPAPLKMPLGLLALPLDPVVDANNQPDPTQSCEVLIAEEGGQTHAMPVGDTRAMPILWNYQKGESGLYNSFGQFFRIGADFSLTAMTTTDGTPAGEAVYQRVDPTGFTRLGGRFCRETLDATGWHLKFPFGRVDLGYVGGLPSPFTALAGTFSVSVPFIALEGTAIALGPDATSVPQQPIALGTNTQAALSAITTALGDISGAVATFVAAAGAADPAIATAATAFATALTNIITPALAAISPAIATVPSIAVTAS